MKEPDFESIKQINVLGHEYWSARNLQKALGYEASWQNFEKVIRAAIIAATSPAEREKAHSKQTVQRTRHLVLICNRIASFHTRRAAYAYAALLV